MDTIQFIDDVFPNALRFEPRPLWWQEQGLMQTATGYGRNLTTRYMVAVSGKVYRVYASCCSNVATLWVTIKGQRYYLRG